MSTYQTMTTGGIYGQEYRAADVEAAAQLAEADGYEVLDIMDDLIVIGG